MQQMSSERSSLIDEEDKLDESESSQTMTWKCVKIISIGFVLTTIARILSFIINGIEYTQLGAGNGIWIGGGISSASGIFASYHIIKWHKDDCQVTRDMLPIVFAINALCLLISSNVYLEFGTIDFFHLTMMVPYYETLSITNFVLALGCLVMMYVSNNLVKEYVLRPDEQSNPDRLVKNLQTKVFWVGKDDKIFKSCPTKSLIAFMTTVIVGFTIFSCIVFNNLVFAYNKNDKFENFIKFFVLHFIQIVIIGYQLWIFMAHYFRDSQDTRNKLPFAMKLTYIWVTMEVFAEQFYRESYLIHAKNSRLKDLLLKQSNENKVAYENQANQLESFRSMKDWNNRIGDSLIVLYGLALTYYFYCVLKQYVKYAPRECHHS